MSYIKIEYNNSHDLGNRILYQNGFENVVYIDAIVRRPQYPIDEDGEENGDKEFQATFNKWQKVYSFDFYAAEFMVDAITLIPLHDYIWITLPDGESNQALDFIVAAVDWQDLGGSEEPGGCFAKVTVNFTVDSIIVTGCKTNMETS